VLAVCHYHGGGLGGNSSDRRQQVKVKLVLAMVVVTLLLAGCGGTVEDLGRSECRRMAWTFHPLNREARQEWAEQCFEGWSQEVTDEHNHD